MKKTWRFVLSLLMVTLLASCGSDNETSPAAVGINTIGNVQDIGNNTQVSGQQAQQMLTQIQQQMQAQTVAQGLTANSSYIKLAEASGAISVSVALKHKVVAINGNQLTIDRNNFWGNVVETYFYDSTDAQNMINDIFVANGRSLQSVQQINNNGQTCYNIVYAVQNGNWQTQDYYQVCPNLPLFVNPVEEYSTSNGNFNRKVYEFRQ